MTSASAGRNHPRNNSAAKRRYWIVGVLAALGLVFLFLVSAPASNRIDSGSTWGKAPDGYGAWYAYMEKQGAPIQRWQRPVADLTAELAEQAKTDTPATLIRVVPPALSGEANLWQSETADWLAQGNRLIELAQKKTVTAAQFSSQVDSEFGPVTVDTRRRYAYRDRGRSPDENADYEGTEISFELALTREGLKVSARSPVEALLADDYGAIVWQNEYADQLNIISATTPFLAANAYQEASGNFAFLADLAQAGGPIWVDEYLHGYKDRDVVVEEVAGTWLGYLAKTPLLVASVQLGIVLLVALIAQNRRIGARQPLPAELANNSEAYIKALAGVLHKANNRDFLVETLAGAERKALARSLGLGEAAVSAEALQIAWQQSTGRSARELDVLQAKPQGEAALQTWLRQLQALVPKAHQSASGPIASQNDSQVNQ